MPFGKTDKRGTIITFTPDSEIFKHSGFEEEIIKIRLKELAYLNKNLTIILVNENTEEEDITINKKFFIIKII